MSRDLWQAVQPTPDGIHQCLEMDLSLLLWRRLHGEQREETRYGMAITSIEHSPAGRWWACNEEYSVPIRFCPFCGRDLRLVWEESR